MEEDAQDVRRSIQELLGQQRLAVLSTQKDGQPYSSLMAFAVTDDLRTIVVATARATRKYDNILAESRVSLLVDNRSTREDDFDAASAVTILGVADQIAEEERDNLQAIYLQRHPRLQHFFSAPSTVFLKINVSCYLLVSRFQQVMELRFD